MPRPPLTDADGEVRELTAEDFRHFRPAREVFTEIWGAEKAERFLEETRRRVGQRGKQKSPVKEAVSVRLDADILAAFRAGGPGWQTRMNAALRRVMPQP